MEEHTGGAANRGEGKGEASKLVKAKRDDEIPVLHIKTPSLTLC